MGVYSSYFSYELSRKQSEAARKLKLGQYTEEAQASRDLATQQAYSRRSPGAAYAEEMIRRNQANQIGAALRMSGGDANKSAAIASAATAQANDATARLQTQGQAFSEDAFRRLYMANKDIAAGKREYRRDKQALKTSSQQNEANAIPDLGFI